MSPIDTFLLGYFGVLGPGSLFGIGFFGTILIFAIERGSRGPEAP
jgi:hypothetical protein